MRFCYTIILFLFLFPSVLIAQELSQSDKEFNLKYEQIAVEVAAKNPELAIKKADSLFIASSNSYQQFKSVMLKATVFAQVGNSTEAIVTAKTAEAIAADTQFYSWQARIAGFISTQYRMSGIYSEAKKYLDKSIVYSKKIKSKDESQKLLGFIYQEKADIAKQEKNYNQAVKYLRISGKITEGFPKENKINYHLLALNDAYLAQALFQVNSFDSSQYYYDRAEKNLALSGFDDTKLNSFILMGKAKLDMANHDEIHGVKKIQKALEHADQAGAIKLTEIGNEELANYYQRQKDSAQHTTHAQQAIETLKKISATKQKMADYALLEAAKEKRSLRQRAIIFIVLCGVIVLVSGITFFLYWHRKKREFRNYQNAIRQLKQNELTVRKEVQQQLIQQKQEEKSEVNTNSHRKAIIPKETEELLIRKLKKFEKGTKFTDKNISLPVLSGMFGTNTKYLSYVITKYRIKNFNQYINHLRINYIIEKMQDSPEYLNYKISSLAEECGFSSHSKFTESFKKEVGVTPSVFIESLNEEENKREMEKDKTPHSDKLKLQKTTNLN